MVTAYNLHVQRLDYFSLAGWICQNTIREISILYVEIIKIIVINNFQFEVLKRFNGTNTSILNSPSKINDEIDIDEFFKIIVMVYFFVLVDYDSICRTFTCDLDFDNWFDGMFKLKKYYINKKKTVLDNYPHESFLNGWWINDLRSGFGYDYINDI